MIAIDTQAGSTIYNTQFTANGSISAVGVVNPFRRGFCYIVGEAGTPTTDDRNFSEDGSFGVGAYALTIPGLVAGTHYRVRAFAIDGDGVAYGNTVTVLTTGSANRVFNANFSTKKNARTNGL